MLTPWVPVTKNSEKRNDEETKVKIEVAYDRANDFWENGERIEALKSIEEAISVYGNHERCFSLHELQGTIFLKLAEETSISDSKCVYLFASLDAFSTSTHLCPDAARSFLGYASTAIMLGDQLSEKKFYDIALLKAERGLQITHPRGQYDSDDSFDRLKKKLQVLMNLAATKTSAVVTSSGTSTQANQMVLAEEEQSKEDASVARLKNFWVSLDDKTKRDFLVVNFESLTGYIQINYGNRVREDFEKVFSIMQDTYRWRCWRCYICSQVTYCFTDCKMHILGNHLFKFEPKSSDRPKCVGKVLADMISSGNWKPVDTAAAANLIKDRAARGEVFVYVNGWCSDFPVAKDDKRENILYQIGEILKSSSCPEEICLLPVTLWDWVIEYTEENLELPQVLGEYLDQCNFFKNPQCICFLGLADLENILKHFIQFKGDGPTSVVSAVVNWFRENSLVNEKIDLLVETTCNLLLDKKLLYDGTHDQLDQTGKVTKFTSTGFYEDVKPQGDKIVSWILDCPEIDKKFVSQMAKGVHNLEIWSAALRIVRGTVKRVVGYYDKRQKMLTYEKMLDEVKAICDREDGRKNANQRGTYALMLRRKCEEHVVKQDDDTKWFLNVVRDVLELQICPRFEDLQGMEYICKLSTSVQNDDVKASISGLRHWLKEEFGLIDQHILLEKSIYEKLIDELPKLSAVDYRLAIIPFVKKYLQDQLITKMLKTNRKPTSASDEQDAKRRRLERATNTE